MVGLNFWNDEKTIRYSLESILKQTHQNLVVYILDNQSTKNTPRIIQDITMDLVHHLLLCL
ncbi:glycosyltransferase family A protein [Candidatus Methylopumilus universalis]|uniref:glycosyltransferase family A protein n=1 Tax=Candidatus Methylopumilus universalis TaxID=2588536 RepID=UPI003BEF2611